MWNHGVDQHDPPDWAGSCYERQEKPLVGNAHQGHLILNIAQGLSRTTAGAIFQTLSEETA